MTRKPSSISDPIIEAEDTNAFRHRTIDDLLFGPLPESHRDPAIIRARQTILATFALIAADRAIDIVLCHDQGQPEGPAREAFVDAAIDLDRAWMSYLHEHPATRCG